MLTLKAIVCGILAVAGLAAFGVAAFVKSGLNKVHGAGVSYTEARQYVQRKEEASAYGMPTILSC